MTNDEINEAISAWFEPKPRGGPAENDYLSSSQCWWWYWDQSIAPHGFVWKAQDWFTQEDYNARLLEAMAERNSYVWMEWDINEWCVMWKPTTKDEDDSSQEYNHPDRKTAIVLAFLKFAGIAHKSDGGEK